MSFRSRLARTIEIRWPIAWSLTLGTAGVILNAIGFSLGLYLTLLKFLTGEPLADRPLLLLVVLLILVGIVLIAMGFLAEMLVTLREDMLRERKR